MQDMGENKKMKANEGIWLDNWKDGVDTYWDVRVHLKKKYFY